MPPKAPKKSTQLVIRVEPAMAAKIETFRRRLSTRAGVPLSQAAAVRHILENALEFELAKKPFRPVGS